MQIQRQRCLVFARNGDRCVAVEIEFSSKRKALVRKTELSTETPKVVQTKCEQTRTGQRHPIGFVEKPGIKSWQRWKWIGRNFDDECHPLAFILAAPLGSA